MRIVFFDLDTLRPDHLGCYGYHRNTSPNLDLIAAEAIRFDEYYCSDAPCLPSRAALMSGRFGIHTGVVGHGGTAADPRLEGASRRLSDIYARESLPALLRQAGLRTVTISPFAERHAAWHFYAGFSEVYNTGKGGNELAEEITPAALDWLERHATEDDWFLHINFWDPHTPYRTPEYFGNPFANEPLSPWFTSATLAEHRLLAGPHKPREIGMYGNSTDPRYPRQPGELADLDDLRQLIDGYDCGIRYMDGQIGRILAALQAKGIYDDLAVIVSADHGENFGELGIYAEHGTADRATCRIPMILRWPGGLRGCVDRGLHYNLDLSPTLAELLGQAKAMSWDGRSYAGAVSRGEDCGRDYLVLSQCTHVCQRSVRFGPWLYLRTYHDGYHLFPQEMLFNLLADPQEARDIATEQRSVCHEAAHLLLEWHDAMMGSMPYEVDPLWTVMKEGGPHHAKGKLSEYCAYLERTERGEAAEQLKKRHPGEFK